MEKEFSSIIAVDIIILNTDAGGYCACIARFKKGNLISRDNSINFSAEDSEKNILGSNQGYETIARISPVDGLRTTTEPILLPNAFSARF